MGLLVSCMFLSLSFAFPNQNSPHWPLGYLQKPSFALLRCNTFFPFLPKEEQLYEYCHPDFPAQRGVEVGRRYKYFHFSRLRHVSPPSLTECSKRRKMQKYKIWTLLQNGDLQVENCIVSACHWHGRNRNTLKKYSWKTYSQRTVHIFTHAYELRKEKQSPSLVTLRCWRIFSRSVLSLSPPELSFIFSSSY